MTVFLCDGECEYSYDDLLRHLNQDNYFPLLKTHHLFSPAVRGGLFCTLSLPASAGFFVFMVARLPRVAAQAPLAGKGRALRAHHRFQA